MTTFRQLNYETEGEVDAISKIAADVPKSWNPSFPHSPEAVEQFRKFLTEERASCLALIAENNGHIIGLHILKKPQTSTVCRIYTLWVDEPFRNQGIGRELKRRGEDWARKMGALKIQTSVFTENVTMLEINTRFGFKSIRIEMEKEL